MGGVPAGTDVEGRDRVLCRGVLYAIGADDVRALLEVAAHATSDDEVVDAARESVGTSGRRSVWTRRGTGSGAV
jgi:hypothetical protein